MNMTAIGTYRIVLYCCERVCFDTYNGMLTGLINPTFSYLDYPYYVL